MSNPSAIPPRPITRLGRIEGSLLRPFLKGVTVSESRRIADRFRLVTLMGQPLRGVPWTPGAKVQVQLGGWVYRTYTPLSWNPVAGSMQLLLYAHGDGPGAAWTRSIEVGHPCSLFGPRSSLDLDQLARPALVFGDETSIGLVHALRSSARGADDVTVVLEVTSKPIAEAALEASGVRSVELVERAPNDAHLRQLEEMIVHHLGARSLQSCLLSGKSTSIQALNKRLRTEGVLRRQIRTKAYWAPGKAGLD